jgi:hypothetical protein
VDMLITKIQSIVGGGERGEEWRVKTEA